MRVCACACVCVQAHAGIDLTQNVSAIAAPKYSIKRCGKTNKASSNPNKKPRVKNNGVEGGKVKTHSSWYARCCGGTLGAETGGWATLD